MFSYLNEFSKEISIGFKNSYDDPRFAGTYTITVQITNFLMQTHTTKIFVELVPVDDSPFNIKDNYFIDTQVAELQSVTFN